MRAGRGLADRVIANGLVERSTHVSDQISVGRASWMSRGACRRAEPDLFFPAAYGTAAFGQAKDAKAVCVHCPVKAECLAYALATSQWYGVWGGTTEDERRAMIRQTRSRPATVRAS